MNNIYIIGDSTVDDSHPPFRGWGWALPQFVREGVSVHNHALSGRSSRSFRAEGLFEPIEKALSAGDLLLIQFGHNDEKDDERHTDPDTTFPEELWRYCDFALSRGAQPVLITPVCRRFFGGDGSLFYTHGEYPRAIRLLAAEKQLPLCDLKADSRELYKSLGEQKTAELFVRLAPGEHPDFPEGHDDRSHFNAHGAQVIAGLVAEELKKLPQCAGFMK
ncbi:MAG: rhamnogalacturonan acetylesterase [Clostridia bacterium]|nr:rhamnogalacturonan acetylesterase [Clostridia bacterium]MBR3273561.1 rhamnogalacturonan acetylesterase [Clostridia bacterium]